MVRYFFFLLLCPVFAVGGPVHRVAHDGGKGASADLITAAIDAASGGDVILVAPGTYTGRVRLQRQFDVPVTVRSEIPYQARLRGDEGAALVAFEARNIIIEGFDMAHAPGNSGALVVQIQDLLGSVSGSAGGLDPVVSQIVLRDNIIHSSSNNDLLKINNGAQDITVEGNLFFDQAGSDEHIDVNSVTGVTIQDNVFFNTRDAGTSSFVVIKDSNGTDDTVLGARDIQVRRNIFLNWQGNDGQGFLRVGEDGSANFEARDVIIENNLFLGNSTDLMRAPLTVQGARDILIRNNTVVGNLPARSFAGRFIAVGANPPNAGLTITQNIFSDPTGTLGSEAFSGVDLFDAPMGSTESARLSGNLYFNGGNPIPLDVGQFPSFEDDDAPTVADPLLPDQAGLVLPTWDGSRFGDGARTIREVFEGLALAYGLPDDSSPALDRGDAGLAATEDLLGRPRGLRPDLGAVEALASVGQERIHADGFEG